MWSSLPTLAGTVATLVFASSVLPMLLKALRSKDLTSYSSGNLILANVGNAIYSLYVFDLPAGPIWALHAFYVVSSALMLFWSRRYAARPAPVRQPTHADGGPDGQIARRGAGSPSLA